MIKGTVKNVAVAFLFLKGEDGIDYFCHKSALKNCKMREVREGQVFEFEPTQGPKGPRAENAALVAAKSAAA